MNKLALVQRLLSECGLGGSVSSTTNQTGEAKQLVDWVDSAYMNILNLSRFWQFMRDDFTFNTTAAVAGYTPLAAGITDLSAWITDDWRCYRTVTTDEQWLEFIPWNEFRLVYQMGSSRTQTGRPMFFTIKPDRSLLFHPIPNDVFTVVGEYQKAPTAMTLDADIPVIPEAYHEAIVWRALIYFAAFHSEPDKFAHGANEFKQVMSAMRTTELPEVVWGCPLA